MAHTQHRHALPKIAASAIGQHLPVKDTAVKDKVVLAATNTDPILGFTIATGKTFGDGLAVVDDGVVKALCAASAGVGAEVGVASTNGALGPIAPASGFTRWSAGVLQNPGQPGETFSVLLRPRQISGAI
jgi:hypothetical protein